MKDPLRFLHFRSSFYVTTIKVKCSKVNIALGSLIFLTIVAYIIYIRRCIVMNKLLAFTLTFLIYELVNNKIETNPKKHEFLKPKNLERSLTIMLTIHSL